MQEIEVTVDKEAAELISSNMSDKIVTLQLQEDGKAGERIKKLRKSEGYNLQQFADRIGSKSTTISSWELGKIQPSRLALKAIAAEFGVSEKWLRFGDDFDERDATYVARRRLISWINNMSSGDVMALTRIMRSFTEK